MKLSIISFTKKGKLLSESIAKALEEGERKIEVSLYIKCEACRNDGDNLTAIFVEASVGNWAREQMQKKNAMLFIGACGIAVRAVAPALTDKLHDAPVLVMDEQGRFVIPVLSGHMGGANELAVYLAKETGAEPVITTATDINGKFAVDLFARRNNLFIVNKEGIAKVSAKALSGQEITISVESGYGSNINRIDAVVKNRLPDGVRFVSYPPAAPVDVVVTSKEDVFDAAVTLRPKEYIIGMGCKRGKSAGEIGSLIERKIGELGISISQIYTLSSISQKIDEQGIVEWCRKEGIPFLTYTAEELQAVEGDFKKSSFVKSQVGVDNVCERAALKACGLDGELILEKWAEDGMTIAVAKREWGIT